MHVLAAFHVERMAEHDIQSAGHKVMTDGDGLLAHPLRRGAGHRQVAEVFAQAAFGRTLVAAIRMRLLSTHEPMCRTGGMPTASQTSRKLRAGLGQRGFRGQQACLGAGDGGAAGLQHQHIALDQLLGQGDMAVIGNHLGIAAADDAARHRECGHR